MGLSACNLNLQSLLNLNKLPASGKASTSAPTIAGKVYGAAAASGSMVAIKSTDEPGASVFDHVKVEDGAYEYSFPKSYNEHFELFAFQDLNGDGKYRDGEPSSTGGRCGTITVETPTRDEYGKVFGGWTLRTCNEEEGPESLDFQNADIRFGDYAGGSAAASQAPYPYRTSLSGGMSGDIVGSTEPSPSSR